MLRIWLASGEELAPVPCEKFRAWDLKRRVRTEHGFPLCLQRLVCGSVCLDDDDHVTAPCELQLVLSNSIVDSARERRNAGEELVRFAADRGFVETARHLLKAGVDKDHYSGTGCVVAGQHSLGQPPAATLSWFAC